MLVITDLSIAKSILFHIPPHYYIRKFVSGIYDLLMMFSRAVLVATPSEFVTVHVYIPPSPSSTSLIRRTQLSS